MVEAYEFSLKPAGSDELSEATERAFLRAVHRNEGQAIMTKRVALLLSDLSGYPRDIVLHALETWKKHSRWELNIHDLEQGMDWRVKQRTVVLNALKGAATV